jgi:hypothetical protein
MLICWIQTTKEEACRSSGVEFSVLRSLSSGMHLAILSVPLELMENRELERDSEK